MLLERYEIGELVAESERNTVRRVKRLRDGARLVIKTSTREYPSVRELRRLEFEHQLLCKVRSPGVIAAVDLERQSGRVALVLEDFGGERLSARTGKALGLAEFFPIARGIAAALDEANRARDIVWIAHELTVHTRGFLLRGVIDAIINQDPGHEARSAAP